VFGVVTEYSHRLPVCATFRYRWSAYWWCSGFAPKHCKAFAPSPTTIITSWFLLMIWTQINKSTLHCIASMHFIKLISAHVLSSI